MSDEGRELERLLEVAANDPAMRPEFIRCLLQSTIYALGEIEGAPHLSDHRTATVPVGASVRLENWKRRDGSVAIPFFSSLVMLQRSIAKPSKYVAFNTRDLFELTAGAILVLNPHSPYSKEFLPDEIQHLLNPELSSHVLDRPMPVKLGEPASYPHDLVNALVRCLKKYDTVKAAYIAWIDWNDGTKPHLIVAIDAGAEIELVRQDVGVLISSFASPSNLIDVVWLSTASDNLKAYFSRQKAVYLRPTN